MIKKIQHSEIDFEKYQNTLQNSVQQNFYAESSVLNQLCESWDLLVFRDYEFVMPVPVKKKYSFKFVIIPLFCQQLGISGPRFDADIEEKFRLYLTKNYKIIYYAFHHSNEFNSDLAKKKNYFIPKSDYQKLRKKYFKGRKSAVKMAKNLVLKEISFEENLPFIQHNFKGLPKKRDLRKFINYLKFLEKSNLLKIVGAFKENQIISLAILISTNEKLSLLGLVNDENFKAENGASFLVDSLLQENIAEKSFDFMGGNIRGLEVFFKSFGAELQQYAIIENSPKDLLKKLLKKG
ncbi:hypothetical protein OA84_08325 [Kaistella solincola]|uniref:GNAT family N-acetyltransferase n=1 Tax=Kaistella solincola TaxID=510955 RepID=A0ABR4ZQ87_9FLAO|nr:hypothetical protein [Kaistella solincola]KIA83506.1 hypothetical protein OA84_08325 [Kaistella solincola]